MVFSFFSVTLLFISRISSLFLLRIYIFLILLPIYFCMLYTLSFRALGILIMILSLLFSHSVMFNSFVTPWTVAHQASLSIGFLREEYWSGLPISSPGDLPDPGIEPRSPALAAIFFTTESPGKPELLLFFKFFKNVNWRLITLQTYIDMNQPWMYMCSPSWTPLPTLSTSHPSGSSQCTSPEHPISCIEPGLVICFTYYNIYVSVLFSQIIPPSPSPTEFKRLFYKPVSLLLSRI